MAPTKLDLSGIYPPIITPFDSNGKIAYEKLKENFESWNKMPFKGYVVLGSNGEAVSLDTEEKVELCKAVRKLAKPSHLIIAGTGCHGTEQTIDLCRRVAEDKSADAVLIISPSFYVGRMTESALGKHYRAVADNSPLPVLLYSVPANTNIDLSPVLVADLASHPNIIGLKDSGGDITKISRIVDLTKDKDFQVIAGSAGFLLPALLMGCVGGVCALANVLGNQVCELYRHFQNHDLERAVELQRSLILPNALVTRQLGVPALKLSMDLAGLYGGPSRSPLQPLQPEEEKQLRAAFTEEIFRLENVTAKLDG